MTAEMKPEGQRGSAASELLAHSRGYLRATVERRPHYGNLPALALRRSLRSTPAYAAKAARQARSSVVIPTSQSYSNTLTVVHRRAKEI